MSLLVPYSTQSIILLVHILYLYFSPEVGPKETTSSLLVKVPNSNTPVAFQWKPRNAHFIHTQPFSLGMNPFQNHTNI